MLRASRGLRRVGPTLLAVVFFVLATVGLARLVLVLPVGPVYAVWAGSASLILVVVDWLVFQEDLRPHHLWGMLLIVVGVLVIGMDSGRERFEAFYDATWPRTVACAYAMTGNLGEAEGHEALAIELEVTPRLVEVWRRGGGVVVRPSTAIPCELSGAIELRAQRHERAVTAQR